MKRLTKRDEHGNIELIGVDTDNMLTDCVNEAEANRFLKALNRLAEYEDTGLTPEDIQEAVDLFKDWKDADIPKELKSWVERCTWHVRKCEESLRELDKYKKVVRELQSRLYEASDGSKQAEEQGLLVRLPCKPGGTVFFPMETDGECEPFVDVGMVFAIGIDENHTMWISVRYKSGLKYYHAADDFGKTVFLTRESAEKALEGMKNEA